jgi:hypothetical protein
MRMAIAASDGQQAGQSVPDQFKACYELFRGTVFPARSYSVMCKLHDSFGSLYNCSEDHNCLGCNFNEAANWVLSYLAKHRTCTDVSESFTFYALRLYLLVERFNIIFEIVGLPEEYRHKHFKVFQHVHKWANFFKHPNAFLLVHHPQYFFEGDRSFKRHEHEVVIDQAFVNEHYAHEVRCKKVWDKLQNKTGVAVLFPDPVVLTREFCAGMNEFVALVNGNQVYREVLASKSTYEGYFQNPCG